MVEGSSGDAVDGVALGLLEAFAGGVVQLRSDGSIANANTEALRLLGLERSELPKKTVDDLASGVFGADGKPLSPREHPASRALQTGRAQPAVTLGRQLVRGQTAWMMASAQPIQDPATGTNLGAFASLIDVTLRKLAEEELGHTRELLRKTQKLARVGTWERDLQSGEVRWTDQLCEICGVTQAQVSKLHETLSFVHPDDRDMVIQQRRDLIDGKTPLPSILYRVVRPDGSERTVWGSAELLRDRTGRPGRVIGTVQDITERQQLELRLRQKQRLEGIGQLAGGIAHDFNNLLQPILINAEMILRGGDPLEPAREIKLAARDGADLTRRLLAFGQRQPFRPVPVDLNRVVEPCIALLQRTLGERIEIEAELAERLPAVLGDRSQLEQVIMNLAVNARDAMRDGGRVTIQTRERGASDVPPLGPGQAASSATRYVELAVSDSGPGMSSQVQARAFDPFFTTKDLGSGSGLGLAVVYGIVQEHDGRVLLESRPGSGSTFRIYLPATDPIAEAAHASRLPGESPTGTETVLVVEDDHAVRRSTVSVLQAAQYRVLAAADTEAALLLFLRHAQEIVLVLTDIGMPGRSGVDLVREIRWHRPETRVLYLTGYNSEVSGRELADPVLHKPCEIHELLAALRAVLDGPSPNITRLP
jgi:two-component system, cell cycle sensor histidine kinase and response regulator CckA